MSTKQKQFTYLVLAGAIIGMALAAVLTGYHVNPGDESSIVADVCGEDGGCKQVAQSSGSVVFGLPVALWGFLFYGAVFVLSFFFLLTGEKAFVQTTLMLALVALAADALLFLYMTIEIGAICNLCVLTYVTTITIVVGAYLTMNSIKKEDSSAGWVPKLASVTSQRTSIMVGLGFAMVLVLATGSLVYARAQASAVASAEKETGEDPNVLIGRALRAFAKKYRAAKAVNIDYAAAPVKGSKNPSLTIVEFADFLCPHCKLTGTMLGQVVKKCPNLIQVRYKHYPLDNTCNTSMRRQLHDGACKLSYASYCAGEQKKFWPMHDLIYADQANLKGVTDKQLGAIARKARLNVSKFKKCMTSDAAKEHVRKDMVEANRLGVSGTPAVFINGKQMRPIEYFMNMLAEQEAKAKRGGTPRCQPQ